MGAFGRLLISRWGGDINHYNGDYSPKPCVATQEDMDASELYWWKYKKRHEINKIIDKIIYQQIDINAITFKHFVNYYDSIGCYEYFLIWKFEWNQRNFERKPYTDINHTNL